MNGTDLSEPCPLCSARSAAVLIPPAVKCSRCRFVFALPYCSQFTDKCRSCSRKCAGTDGAAQAYYAPHSPELRQALETGRLGRIKKLCGPAAGRRVLEIGAGAGALASLLIKSGADYSGLEPTRFLYLESLRAFPEAAAKIRNTFLPPEGFRRGAYDLIIAADVLEYIAGPVEFLKKLAPALRPGGAVYLEVPDETFFSPRTRVRRALRLYSGIMHPGHINFFSPATLLSAIRAAGLTQRASGRFTLLGNADRLAATLRRPLPVWLRAASLAARLTRLDLALGFGNIYAVCSADPS